MITMMITVDVVVMLTCHKSNNILFAELNVAQLVAGLTPAHDQEGDDDHGYNIDANCNDSASDDLVSCGMISLPWNTCQ